MMFAIIEQDIGVSLHHCRQEFFRSFDRVFEIAVDLDESMRRRDRAFCEQGFACAFGIAKIDEHGALRFEVEQLRAKQTDYR